MEVKQIVDHFRKTIMDYGIPYEQIVIAPHSNGIHSDITMFNGISVVDYMTCDEQSVELISKQVAKELHVAYQRGILF